jgi:A/G-specific adenine glycosylase
MQAPQFQTALLRWYGKHKRALPWRTTQNPYHLLIAETMLQQTTVATVLGYYEKFLQSFPTVQVLAQARIDDVLHHWQGLGYYRRAHNLHKGAQTLAQLSHFPETEDELLEIPGIGPYTAAVLAATAFNQPAVVVDGNVERVMSRLFAVKEALPKAKPILRQHAAQLASVEHPRDYANAIMELGALVCTPKSPDCEHCPVQKFCEAFKQGEATAYPKKDKKKELPHRHATTYVLRDTAGNLYLRQRPATGLLSSLWELPHEGWEKTLLPKLKWHNEQPAGSYTHTFTHFKLTLIVVSAEVEEIPAAHKFSLKKLPPLSTLMKNALALAL